MVKKKFRYSYQFMYTIIGGSIGIIFPIGALLLDFAIHEYQISLRDLYYVNPIHLLIASTPLILGFMAGFAGIREEKLFRHRQELEGFAHDLTERSYEIGDIMDHIEEGILTINIDLSMNRVYSGFIETIFGKSNLAGKNFLQLVYPTGKIKEKNDLKEFIHILFTNFSTSDEVLKSLNPIENLEHAYSEEKGEVLVKYLQFEFVRIMLQRKLTKVMVIIKDMTETVKKERQHAKVRLEYEEELERISALLKMPKKELEDFLVKCDNTAFYIESFFSTGIETISAKTEELLKLLGDLHSLKGEANLYGLKQLAIKIHALEGKSKHVIDSLGKEKQEIFDPTDDSNKFMNQIMEIMVAISDFRISIRHLKETKNKMIARVREEETGQAASQKYFPQDFLPKARKLKEALGHILNAFDTTPSDNSTNKKESWLDNLVPLINKRIDELNEKGEVRKIFSPEINNDLSFGEISNLSVVKASVIHLVQNSLVHGIEPPLERVREGKNEKGKIKLSFQKNDNYYEIWVEDDGQGIILEKIKKALSAKSKMKREEIDKLTLKDAIKVIFRSGFTSLDSADQIAGRGIGMDAIRRQVQDYNGRLLVRNRPGKGLVVCLSFSIDAICR